MPSENKEPPPEGPEVKRITDQLNEQLSGSTITGIDILSGRYTKKLPQGYSEFENNIPYTINAVNCKGKFIYFSVGANDWYIWNTLGMSGSWSKEPSKHARVRFDLYGKHIYFIDMRNFGTLKFVHGKKELEKKLKSLGPDMLAEDLPDSKFKWFLKNAGAKTSVEFLMNQKNISGVGNYIKAEALYLAKISPHRACYKITPQEAEDLNRAIKSVIRTSYETGGSTFKTYADFNGEVGTFSDRFMVYRQKKDPLGNDVIKQETDDKRTTHWVPAVQR